VKWPKDSLLDDCEIVQKKKKIKKKKYKTKLFWIRIGCEQGREMEETIRKRYLERSVRNEGLVGIGIGIGLSAFKVYFISHFLLIYYLLFKFFHITSF
jgi:hypothetical protein